MAFLASHLISHKVFAYVVPCLNSSWQKQTVMYQVEKPAASNLLKLDGDTGDRWRRQFIQVCVCVKLGSVFTEHASGPPLFLASEC